MQIRDITIKAVLNGFIVTVGCQTLVVASRQELLTRLRDYLEHPVEMEQEYLAKAENARFVNVGPATPGTPFPTPQSALNERLYRDGAGMTEAPGALETGQLNRADPYGTGAARAADRAYEETHRRGR